jgi:thioredoxin reductase (NADPH)
VLRYGKSELQALTVIIATGATARKLGIKGEAELGGRGVSYCATCDGFFFKEKSVAVIGGGDSAMEEAIYLAGLCGKVTVIHRRDRFRACEALVDRAGTLGNMEFLYDHVPLAFVPTDEDLLRGVQVKNVKTGEERLLEVDGAFVAIGHDPKSALFRGQLELDGNGYIVTEKGGTATSMEGVYAAGDVQDNNYQQAVTAAGTGCMAAYDAIRYLESM